MGSHEPFRAGSPPRTTSMGCPDERVKIGAICQLEASRPQTWLPKLGAKATPVKLKALRRSALQLPRSAFRLRGLDHMKSSSPACMVGSGSKSLMQCDQV